MQYSVIIPVYQAGKYLRVCLESIICQYDQNLEIILIDDGSDDGSERICEEYAARYAYIKCLHQEKRGAAAARNQGLEMATKDYLVFIDADDYVSPDYFACLDDSLREGQDACMMLELTEFTAEEHTSRILWGGLHHGGIRTYQEYASSFLGYPCLMCEGIWKREMIMRAGISFDEGYMIGEDTKFVMQAMFACKTYSYLQKPCYYYRRDVSDSLTRVYADRGRGVSMRLSCLYCSMISVAGIVSEREKNEWIKDFHAGAMRYIVDRLEYLHDREELDLLMQETLTMRKNIPHAFFWRGYYALYKHYGCEKIARYSPYRVYDRLVAVCPAIRRGRVWIYEQTHKKP